jgi:exopolysaccharide production protein ExoY
VANNERGVAVTSYGGTEMCRRAFDVAVSGCLAVLTLPVVLIAALGSAAVLRAWPFFSQERIGKDGQPFRFLKVRTLPPVTPSYIDKHELANHHIPRFCRFLRALHLDELPQLYLVLAGHMSLVGPRPEMACLHDRMPASFATLRTSVRPGCTGFWQVSESCNELISAAPEYDSFYLAHRTLRFDLWVLGRTALKMTGLAGCVTLEKVPSWVLPTERRRADDVVIELAPGRMIDLRDERVDLPAEAGFASAVGR